ncbi:RNA polymerase sigma-I factor [Alicyclobacillus sp. SO9]|uniref:RNA polymerase sigma-I factor n=1 Tax=Alicyclobacillus sp. SO9 TaxID=2665646 RepID=UPI0018E7DA70|nr:RNA polymerase sigma-I factor [Alicyclobacillus sp. SO9]QQE77462.1 RNA polymerase sigma-I factor [Alicyclobacillus sp. SO9]
MGVFPFRRKRSTDLADLKELLMQSQAGDQLAREKILTQYRPFVLRVASQVAGRYIDMQRDDEYSIALMAMNEAIDNVDISKSSFLNFSETVIRRRLIDYFRSQKSQSQGIPWTEFDVTDDEDNVVNYAETTTSLQAYEVEEERGARKLEIDDFSQILSHYGLSFGDLVAASPKHQDARDTAMGIAQLIASDNELLEYVKKKKTLPMKRLEQHVTVSRKTLERQRKYILAITVLLDGDYPMLREYIRG